MTEATRAVVSPEQPAVPQEVALDNPQDYYLRLVVASKFACSFLDLANFDQGQLAPVHLNISLVSLARKWAQVLVLRVEHNYRH